MYNRKRVVAKLHLHDFRKSMKEYKESIKRRANNETIKTLLPKIEKINAVTHKPNENSPSYVFLYLLVRD